MVATVVSRSSGPANLESQTQQARGTRSLAGGWGGVVFMSRSGHIALQAIPSMYQFVILTDKMRKDKLRLRRW